MRFLFEDEAWEDYTSWLKNDRKTLARINKLIEDVKRDSFSGIGKPEPLKHHLPRAWSRRVDDEHRLVHLVADREMVILAARYRYEPPGLPPLGCRSAVGRCRDARRGRVVRGPSLFSSLKVGTGDKGCGSGESPREVGDRRRVHECARIAEPIPPVRTEVVCEQVPFAVGGRAEAEQSV